MKPGVGLKLAYGIIVACGFIVAITVVVPSDAAKADVALTFTPAEIDLTGGSTIFAEQDVTACNRRSSR